MRRIQVLMILTMLTACGDDVEVSVPAADMALDAEVERDMKPPVDMGGRDDTGPIIVPDMDMDVTPPDPVPNQGWIGGACGATADCEFADALCDTTKPDGQCTLACDRTCPDLDGNNSVTFCVTDNGAGRCVARCDHELFPEVGCRTGYECKIFGRNGEPGTQQAVCVPEGTPNPNATTACLRQLDELGVIWSPWNYTTQTDGGLSCTINDPIRVASPINGIEYRYYSQATAGTMAMACELAVALHRLGEVLKEYQMKSVLHIGTFNCRKIGGSSSLSQHSYGKAIDIWGFEDTSNVKYILENDWQHNTTTFSNDKARILHEIGQRMHNDRIFNIVLTPNYNAAHDNHFHVDLTTGSNFIGLQQWPEYYIGDEHWEMCPQD